MAISICLEGERGDWGWFNVNIKEPNLGLNMAKVEKVCGTDNPSVIDVEYTNEESSFEGLLTFDGMGYTPLSALIEQAESLADFETYELEEIAAYLNIYGGDVEDAINSFENHQYWKTDNSNIEDFATEYLQETGYNTDLLAEYFDYDALGEELLNDPDYEPLGNGNAWDEGELYIDNYYGDVKLFIEEKGNDVVFDYYFNTSGFANGNLRYGFDYDENTGIWVSESVKTKRHTKFMKESKGSKKYTGKTWKEFINDIETNSKFYVDSAYKDKYHDWIILYSKFTKDSFDGNVTKYNDGTYELMDYNIKGSYESLNHDRKLRIKESFNEEKLEFNGYEFDPYSSWNNIWTDVISPIVDSHFGKIGINGYTQQEAEDDIDAIINIFNDEFGTQYPNVTKACDKFFNA